MFPSLTCRIFRTDTERGTRPDPLSRDRCRRVALMTPPWALPPWLWPLAATTRSRDAASTTRAPG